jgi:methyl-accepting chemotaxis protein
MTRLLSLLKPELIIILLASIILMTMAIRFGYLPPALRVPLTFVEVAFAGIITGFFLLQRKVIAEIGRTSAAVERGEMDRRVTIPGLAGDLGLLADRVNRMIAVNAAYLRESGEIMQAASERRFDRRIRLDSLAGDHRRGAEQVNEAIDRLAAQAALMQAVETSFAQAVAAAGEGDFSRRIDTNLPDPALARLAGLINDLLATVERGLGETGDVLAALARADLKMRMKGEHRGAFGTLRDNVNALAASLEEIVSGIIDSSEALHRAQSEILTGSRDLADRTNAGATAVEETSAAMEEISVTTNENARKAAAGGERAGTVATAIADVRETMQAAETAMQRISSAAAQIEGIVTLIDTIAFQTRLLALNASVEAARAGEAGRGFAVVAAEVRNLAERVVSSSGEIKSLVDQSGDEVRQGSVLVGRASSKLAEVLDLIRSNADEMREIAAACGEQANAVSEISAAVAQLEETMSQNSALVERVGASLQTSETRLQQLESMVSRFRLSRPLGQQKPATVPAPVAASKPPRAQAARPARGVSGNTALAEDWSEF